MSLSHTSDEELITTATTLAGYHDTGPVLKELLARWQKQQQLAIHWHRQITALAAESELLRGHTLRQSDAISEILALLGSGCLAMTAEQQTAIAAGIDKLAIYPILNNAVSQLRADELDGLKTALKKALSSSPRIREINGLDRMVFNYCITSTIARRKAELLYLPIGPVTVERDGSGLWTHPASALQPDWDESTPAAEIQAWFRAQGLEVRIVNLGDQDGDLFERCMEDGDASGWDPEPPEGDGWFLFSIFDSEDGIHAEFARQQVSE